jgi:hypothetical protein
MRPMLAAPLRLAWRWLTGMPLDGVQRSDATWFTRGTRMLDPATAPRPPEKLGDEIRADVKAFRAQRWDMVIRRRLGRELRDIERQVVAEDDPE